MDTLLAPIISPANLSDVSDPGSASAAAQLMAESAADVPRGPGPGRQHDEGRPVRAEEDHGEGGQV